MKWYSRVSKNGLYHPGFRTSGRLLGHYILLEQSEEVNHIGQKPHLFGQFLVHVNGVAVADEHEALVVVDADLKRSEHMHGLHVPNRPSKAILTQAILIDIFLKQSASWSIITMMFFNI